MAMPAIAKHHRPPDSLCTSGGLAELQFSVMFVSRVVTAAQVPWRARALLGLRPRQTPRSGALCRSMMWRPLSASAGRGLVLPPTRLRSPCWHSAPLSGRSGNWWRHLCCSNLRRSVYATSRPRRRAGKECEWFR